MAARHAGGLLLQRGRVPEAEALLEAANARFPRAIGLQARRAFASEAAGRGAEALARWQAVCAAAPWRVASWLRLAACARAQGDLASAERAIDEALARRPADRRVRLEAALVAEAAEAPALALDHWSFLVARRRPDPRWRQGLATSLMALGRFDDAQAVLKEALRRHPGYRGLAFVEGQLALRRENWDAAVEIFSDFKRKYPDDEHAATYLARVAAIRELAQAEARGQPPQLRAPVEVERVEDDGVRELMLRFEGIGADCEFGTLQRRYGAEPLGLLRWNDVTYPTLVAALEARFAGMGEPETTELVAGRFGELYVRDRRWDLGMHTFLFERETSRETLFPKMCRRVAYLRDKFLADLAADEKILVFKSDHLAVDELAHLHGLLKRHGPARLLHVRRAVSAGIGGWPQGKAGEVATIAPDLHVGYVSRMGDLHDVPYDEWLALCRARLAADATTTARPS